MEINFEKAACMMRQRVAAQGYGARKKPALAGMS